MAEIRLPPVIENILPKFELAPIFIYLTMLPKVFLPSITPVSSTIRLFLRRMISADSFGDINSIIDRNTDVRRLKSRRVVYSVPQIADDMLIFVQSVYYSFLLKRRKPCEYRCGFYSSCKLPSLIFQRSRR